MAACGLRFLKSSAFPRVDKAALHIWLSFLRHARKKMESDSHSAVFISVDFEPNMNICRILTEFSGRCIGKGLRVDVSMTRRRFLAAGCCAAAGAAVGLSACGRSADDSAIIYSCGEGEANEAVLAAIHEALPAYDIRLHYVNTGSCAAKLKTEGPSCEADVVLGLEGGYLMQVEDSLAPLSDAGFDFSRFAPDLLDGSETYLPFRREAACVTVHAQGLAERGLRAPSSYADLLDPAFKGAVCMPNPKSSGTGYNFLKSLVNAWGEEEAFAYFDALAENVYQFSSSGSGPVNALVQGEAVVGLGLTYQAVSEINKGVPLEIVAFEEGSPWTMNGLAAVAGKQDKPAVRALMQWFYDEGILLDKRLFVPDEVFVDQDVSIENYPQDIVYADMTGVFDADEKQRLLKRWKY